ncbi:hypothetical protein [Gracilibacillus lacisalsi]|uniref:hypothetical protein n=1 Tax=Gracilibacillus lacisalsi TaxID=393087 RepID=UPI00037F09A9|nr:hypothetical protein [Gracilibacillus lacisalsi]
MDNMFSNLKEKMNGTILKDVEFSEKSKDKVRKAIRSSKSRKKYIIHPKLNYILSLSVSCILILGLGYFSLSKLDDVGDKQITENSERSLTTKSENNEKAPNNLNEGIYTPPEKKEYYDDMTKEEILTKMLNTPDYFQTVVGKFEQRNIYNDGTGTDEYVDYEISIENEIGGHVSFVNKSLEGETVQENISVYNDRQQWDIDLITNSYLERNYNQKEFQPVSIEEVLPLDSNQLYDKLLDIYDWQEPPVWIAGVSLFPFYKTVQYLGDVEQWDIEKQNEELLGHNTVVLYGSVGDKVDRMKNVDTFRFWVDKDTGILAKYEEYDSNGNITGYLYPEKLEVNASINLDEFSPNLDGLSKEEQPETIDEDSGEEDIEILEQSDYYKDEVNEVLQTLRQNIDFLYEFTGQDFDLYATSFERYKDFNHAYLTYSYKKDPNEDGSGTRLLYVRSYHKDSVTRSWGEFDTNKGERLDTFTTNDIDWKMYELDRPKGAHFVGSSNDYKYEVVSQDISAEETKTLLESFKKSVID